MAWRGGRDALGVGVVSLGALVMGVSFGTLIFVCW